MLRAMISNRYRAGAAYLAASLAIAIGAYVLILQFYPSGLFATVGGVTLFWILMIVNLVIGPLLVFIVFVPGKRGLAFDLVVITALQAAALAYGLSVLYTSRPVYIVFVKDRFELVRANELEDAELARAGRFAHLPLWGPDVVGSRIPQDPVERDRIVTAAIAGADLQYFPRHYVEYDTVRVRAGLVARSIAQLRELNPPSSEKIDRLVAATGRPESELAFLPLRADKRRELAAIVDVRSGELLRVAELRPWK